MKLNTIALLGVMIVAGIGVGLASSTIFATPLLLAQAQETGTSDHFGIMGHIEFTATDSDGNIKQYIQTDNTIINIGENCMGELLFDVDMTGGGDACTGTGITTGTHGSSGAGFTFLAIGLNTGATAEAENNVGMDTQSGSRIQETSQVPTPSTGASGTSGQVVLSEVFTPGAVTIAEAGLFDASTAGNMLARQVFTGIPLGASDQLTVQWTITIGG